LSKCQKGCKKCKQLKLAELKGNTPNKTTRTIFPCNKNRKHNLLTKNKHNLLTKKHYKKKAKNFQNKHRTIVR
jgi:hypothetical protein